MTTRRATYLVIRLLPILHLCICIAIGVLNVDWFWVIFIADLPASVLIAPLPWYGVPPLLAYGSLGTVWWLGLSVLILRTIGRQERKPAPTQTIERSGPSIG